MAMTIKKHLAAATAALSLSFTGAAQAWDHEPVSNEELGILLSMNHGLMEPPECTYQGKTVSYYGMSGEDMWNNYNQAYGAFAGRLTNDDIIIVIDKNLFPRLPHLLQDQIYKHECAHFTAGDLDGPPEENTERDQVEEDRADCTSITQMRAEGLTQEQLDTIITYHKALAYGYRLPEDLIKARSENFQSCFDNGPAIAP